MLFRSAVLAWTAAQMIVNEALLAPWFEGDTWVHDASRWATYIASVVGVLGLGHLSTRKRDKLTVSSV